METEIPEKIIIPLRQGFGNELNPCVKKGDRVKSGQIIGINNDIVSSPVHSSVNGKVVEIKKINYFKREINAIEIMSDGTREYLKLEGCAPDWNKLPVEKLEELLYKSGVTSLDREGIPTGYKSSIIRPEDVEAVIVHGISSEVYNISLEVLLGGKNIFNFLEGLKILKKILSRSKIYIALNIHDRKFLESITKLTAEYDWLEIYPLEPKYPQGYDEILVPTLLGKKFPYGYSAANIGVVILNIQAVTQVYDAVVNGKPLIERTIALCGPGWKDNVHLKVRVGALLGDITGEWLKEGVKSRIILNSLITGVCLNDLSLPIERTFSQLIAVPENAAGRFMSFLRPGYSVDSYTNTFLSAYLPFANKDAETNMHGEQRACITCGYCEEICPVGIIPHLLSKYSERNILDETVMRYKIFNCIDCNLCSYVCPSKIPLARHIKEGQEKLITMGCDSSACILPFFDLKGLEEYRGIK